MRITVKYFDEKYGRIMQRLMQTEQGDWIDLYTPEDIELEKGDFKIIPLGIAMSLPIGCEALIVPRSSTFKNWGLLQTNSVGVIDNKYCGNDDEWGLPVYATANVKIPANTRLCQFRVFYNQPRLTFEEGVLSFINRGGFGSTGK